MSNLNILISGAGIAGPVLAYFLARGGHTITILERSSTLRTGGQNVDVRGAGLEVVRRMGLESAVKERTTNEAGVAFVDSKNRRAAAFPVDPSGRAVSLTAEIEIMRGDLAEVFYNATRNNANYIFGTHITAITEDSSDNVTVTFNDRSSHTYDLVVLAEGLGSSTRPLVFTSNPIHPLNQYVAWFTLARARTDGVWARWYNAPGRRMILLRPDTKGSASDLTRASLWICTSSPAIQGYSNLDVAAQKALMRSTFADAGWEADRILAGMDAADDFYMQEVAQVKMRDSPWSRGRVALLGDAAFCPSPISGMGTTVAITGAYVLAGEIVKDVNGAFERYESRMRPFVEKAQKLMPGTPWLANPQTAWGIWIFNLFLGFVSWSGIAARAGRSAGPPVWGIELPVYEFEDLKGGQRT